MSVRKRALKWRGDLECLEHRQLLTLSLVANEIFPTQGILFSSSVATLFDEDPTPAQPSDFNVKIVWQGGQSTSGTVTSTSNGSIFEVEGSYTYPQAGSFNTQITVTDNKNQSASAQGLALVSAQRLTILGAAVTGIASQSTGMVPVANFIDPNTADQTNQFNALVAWGDGDSSLGTVVRAGGQSQFTVMASHTYASPGTYTTTITVVGQGNVPGGSATGTANISAPAGFALTGQPIVAPAGQPLNNVVVATISDPVTTDTENLFTAMISWGDGQATQGNVTGNSGKFNITGSHTYATPGSFPITVTLANQAGKTFSTSSTATIQNAETNVSFTGGLAPITGNGPNAVEGYTNTNRPTFSGTSAPFAIVQLYARYLNVDAELPLGEAVASANGQWTLTTGPLARGVSVVTAVVTIPAGYPSTAMTLSNQNGTNLVYIDLAPAPVKRPPHRRVEAPHPKMLTSQRAMLKPHGPRHL
ncbi:MAG: Ig-like domain-containing protein [Isosphaeraceae bacterium]|jgi:hypothetical protein